MNRRDILKAVAVAPFLGLIGNIRKQDASATTDKVIMTPTGAVHLTDVPRLYGITGHYTENHHWTGPNGEHMKVEHLARIYDDYDYFFAVYQPGKLGYFMKPFYRRFSLAGFIYDEMPELAQKLYEEAVSRALDDYYTGVGFDRDQDLSIEMFDRMSDEAKSHVIHRRQYVFGS